MLQFLKVIETHDDNDSFDASWDPHHMPITNTTHKSTNRGTPQKCWGPFPWFVYGPTAMFVLFLVYVAYRKGRLGSKSKLGFGIGISFAISQTLFFSLPFLLNSFSHPFTVCIELCKNIVVLMYWMVNSISHPFTTDLIITLDRKWWSFLFLFLFLYSIIIHNLSIWNFFSHFIYIYIYCNSNLNLRILRFSYNHVPYKQYVKLYPLNNFTILLKFWALNFILGWFGWG